MGARSGSAHTLDQEQTIWMKDSPHWAIAGDRCPAVVTVLAASLAVAQPLRHGAARRGAHSASARASLALQVAGEC